MNTKPIAKFKIGETAVAVLFALSIGLITLPSAAATSVNSTAIAEAAKANSLVDEARCRVRRVCNRWNCWHVRRCWPARCRVRRVCDRWSCWHVRRCW